MSMPPGPTVSGGSSPAQLQKAYLAVYAPAPDGRTSSPGSRQDPIEFQFNPKELTFTKAANWVRKNSQKAATAGAPEYRGPAPSSLSVEAFFDATATMDDSAAKAVTKLVECCVPAAESENRGQASPSWVVFHWGGFSSPMSYIKQVQVKYSVFRPDGVPVRATAVIALEDINGPPKGTNPTSGSEAATREHVMVEGDSLPVIAFAEYGSTATWRDIAAANGIDDPARIPVGTRLLLPAPSELRR